jgi:hypothetical protein
VTKELPGFRCEWDLKRGATQLRDLYAHVKLDAEGMAHPPFTRIKQLRHLLATAAIDSEFYWKT